MYLWQRYANSSWLEKNELRLIEMAPKRVAIVRFPGKRQHVAQMVCQTLREANCLQDYFGGKAIPLPRDWARTFQRHNRHPPLRIGRRLLIVSERQESQMPQLLIPAAGAFGTGEHATTAMCLRLLEETTRRFAAGWKLLDLGTGTGILALAARRFGAHAVIGLDNDPRAVQHARANARANKIGNGKFFRTDVLQWRSNAHFEVITANLFSELLISALPIFAERLTESGRMILSGILREQAPEILRSLGKLGFRVEKKRRRGKWVALLARRQPEKIRCLECG